MAEENSISEKTTPETWDKMKNKQYLSALALAGAFTASSALAGPYVPPVVEEVPPPPMPPPPAPEAADGLGANISVGYNTDYIWRGSNFGRDQVWADVNMDINITDEFVINFGAWYSDIAGDNKGGNFIDLFADQELDLYASADLTLGWFDFSVGYTYYWFDEHFDDFHEASIGTGVTFWNINVGLTYYYEFTESNHWVELTADTSFALTDNINLVPGVMVSYLDGNHNVFNPFMPSDEGMHNAGASLALEIALTDTATLVPYVAYSYDLDTLKDLNNKTNDYFYGGISLNVSF